LKLSIVTVCYNSETTIRSTLESVSEQGYGDIEHVIIDGESTDGTLSILNEYHLKNKVVVSEPDNGIYDAMNKGIKLASGDVVGTLNADDFYINDQVISHIAEVFEDPAVEACYADLVYVSPENTKKVVRYWKSQPYQNGLFKSGWMPAHPTFFVRKNVYERLGFFDSNFKIAADFELLFRFIEQHKIKTVYIPKVIVKMRTGGTTNKNIKNIFIQNKEIISTLKAFYTNFSLIKFVVNKLVNRFAQFTKRPGQQ